MVLKFKEMAGTVSLVRCMDHDSDNHRPADIVRLDFTLSDPVYCHIFPSQLMEMAKWITTDANITLDIEEPVTEFGSPSYLRRRQLYQHVEDRFVGGIRAFLLRHGARSQEVRHEHHIPNWPGFAPSH